MEAKAQEGLAEAARTFDRVVVVRELAGRPVPTAIVHAFAPQGAELALDERYETTASLDSAALVRLESDARAAMSLRHPNVAAVRDVWHEGSKLHVTSELVEGETLEELRKLAGTGNDFSLEVGVRIIVDVLGALSAMHSRASGTLLHGEVSAPCVIVGYDGTTRLVRPYRGGVAGKVGDAEWFSYAAPEVIRGENPSVRADVFAVGALLWETLTRRKLFPKASRDSRLARTAPVGKPVPPTDAAWAAPLAVVTERALAYDVAARYASAAEMAAAVRLAVRSKLAMPPRVAAAVDKLAGAKIVERRTRNALPAPEPSARTSVRPAVPEQATRALAAMRPSSRPPPPKAPEPRAIAPVIPKAPLLPVLEPPPVPKTPPRARPSAPPLRLATPTPASAAPTTPIPNPVFPPVQSEPILPAVNVPPVAEAHAPSTPGPIVSPLAPPRSRRTLILVAAVVMAALLVFGVTVAVMASKSSPAVPSASAVSEPPPLHTAVTAPTATHVATAEPTAAASTVSPPPEAATSTAAPDETVTAPTTTAPHHTRPRPTYDPMGI